MAKKPSKSAKSDLEQQRDALVALLPDAILAIANCIRKPSRNAQTQLAAAKTVLDRAGLPALATTTVTADPGDGAQVTLNVNFLPPKKKDEDE